MTSACNVTCTCTVYERSSSKVLYCGDTYYNCVMLKHLSLVSKVYPIEGLSRRSARNEDSPKEFLTSLIIV